MHTIITRKIRSTESKCTLSGKFHFLVKTITDSDRLGLVYLNLAFSTANGVMFCEIYLQSAAHIITDPRFIYFIFKFFLTDP